MLQVKRNAEKYFQNCLQLSNAVDDNSSLSKHGKQRGMESLSICGAKATLAYFALCQLEKITLQQTDTFNNVPPRCSSKARSWIISLLRYQNREQWVLQQLPTRVKGISTMHSRVNLPSWTHSKSLNNGTDSPCKSFGGYLFAWHVKWIGNCINVCCMELPEELQVSHHS